MEYAKEQQYTDEQILGFQEEFAKRQLRRQVITAPLIVLALAAGLGVLKTPSSPGIWDTIAFALVLGAVIFDLWDWRCPACNRYLYRRWAPESCPRCGIEFDGTISLHL